MSTGSERRRRRQPEDAEREILDAAERALREGTWHELTVDELMRRTGLSRASFYVYFKDRAELLRRLVRRVRSELDQALEVWRSGAADPGASGRTAIAGMASVYQRHGALLQALEDASSNDPAARRAYRGFLNAGIKPTAARIREQIASGQMKPGLDPDRTAEALCAMNHQYLMTTVAQRPRASTEPAVETLLTIWTRALYGQMPEPADLSH
jgi:AcrR family transcriptional regulator